jgi:glycosyltransferase involved in cell wall biosynthesis
MRNIIPDNKEIVCIPNGVDTIKYNTEIDGRDIKDKYSPDKPLIVFAKPLYDYNTPSAILLVETINELKNDMPVNLLLGDGDGRKKVENAASRLNVTDRVFFMPWVPMTEIPKYLAASDIIVLPYLYEATTSRSFLEALAMGKATIISNLGEPAKLVKNMEECIIVNPTVKELIPAMKLLLINTDIRTRLEVNARKKALDYSFEKVITKTVDVYNKYCNVKK